jgi:peptidoglycan/LPS O-acetylase OafA/YrhL
VHSGGLFGLILALRTEQPVLRTLGGIALTATMATLLALPAVFGERAGGWPRRLLAARSLTYLGVISYSVYLYHLPIAHLLGLSSDPQRFSAAGLGLVARVDHGTTAVLFALTLALSVVVASVSYRVVELPFLRRKG